MDFETKTISSKLDDYLFFGWNLISTRKNVIKDKITFEYVIQRDRSSKNYAKYVGLEKRYFELKKRIRTYVKPNPLICILYFVLFVFPFIFYLAYKANEKKEIEENNKKITHSLDIIIREAKEIA